MAQEQRLLVVDNKEMDRTTIAKLLEADGYAVTTAANGAQALAIFKQHPFPIVITDIYMPEMTGLDLLSAVKEISDATQVIMMTRFASIDDAICALRSGASDYLIKPFDDKATITEVVQRAAWRIQSTCKTHRLIKTLRHKNQRLEVTNLHLKKLATRDSLTGLYNHRHFHETMSVEINRVKRYHRPFSLLFIDLDNFKIFNDTNGHVNGDRLLLELSNLFLDSFRKTDIVCRYGGDEFGVIIPEATKQEARGIAGKLHQIVAEHPFAGREILPQRRVTISIGVATCPDDGMDAGSLLHHADALMYDVKKIRANLTRAIQSAPSQKCSRTLETLHATSVRSMPEKRERFDCQTPTSAMIPPPSAEARRRG
jgi:diguanylate cyclase (GGDEF)-like protein